MPKLIGMEAARLETATILEFPARHVWRQARAEDGLETFQEIGDLAELIVQGLDARSDFGG